MVGSFLSQHRRIAAIVATALTGFAAYYLINRHPVVQPNQDSPPPKKNGSKEIICYQHHFKVVFAPIISQIHEQAPLSENLADNSSDTEPPNQEYEEEGSIKSLRVPPLPETPTQTPPVENKGWAGGRVRQLSKLYEEYCENGIDLIPYFFQAAQAGKAYANAPTTPYDPFTANLMKGFSEKFGSNVHFLLHNAMRLKGAKFAGKLAKSLNIAESMGTATANQIMKLSNPLGWASFILQISDLGSGLLDFSEGGVLALLDEQIDQLILQVGKKIKIPKLEVVEFQSKEEFEKARTAYWAQRAHYVQKLEEIGLNERVANLAYAKEQYPFHSMILSEDALLSLWFTTPLASWRKNYDNALEDKYAPASYKAAKSAWEKAETHLKKVQDDLKAERSKKQVALAEYKLTHLPAPTNQPTRFGQAFNLVKKVAVFAKEVVVDSGKINVLKTFSKLLKNSARRTLGELIKKLNRQIDEDQNIPENMKESAKIALEKLVMGVSASNVINWKLEITKEWINNCNYWAQQLKKPATFMLSYAPNVRDRYRDLFRPVSEAIGNMGGDILIGALDEKAIDQMNLKNLKAQFNNQSLNFEKLLSDNKDLNNIVSAVKGGIMVLGIKEDIDHLLQTVVQKAGEKFAIKMSEALAENLRKKAPGYSTQDLMTKIVPRNITQNVGYGLGLAISGTAPLIAKAANEIEDKGFSKAYINGFRFITGRSPLKTYQ